MNQKISFSQPVVLPEHLKYLQEAMQNNHLAGAGPFTKKCEKILEEMYATKTFLVGAGTHALDMMAILLDIKEGDEVIAPSFTFVSTANSFVLFGARIRFADCDEYGNILPSEVRRLKTTKTRAVIAVHYAAHATQLEELVSTCKELGIPLLEDAAQCIGAKYKNKYLGTFGDLACISFHETKNITSGEGGAIIINNKMYADRADIIRQKGTNRANFYLGLVDKYTWVDKGSSYLMSDMCAAYLYPQLLMLEKINGKRGEIWNKYKAELKNVIISKNIKILEIPEYNTSNYHLFSLIFENQELRDIFIKKMKEKNIMTPYHYVPLHQSPYGKQVMLNSEDKLINADKISHCSARLPLFFNMSTNEVDRVITAVKEFIKN